MSRPSRQPVLCVVGARPNYMKMAPLLRAMAAEPRALPTFLCHTGQHYDPALNRDLFVDLKMPEPNINLEVGSGSQSVQTAEIMKRFEPVVERIRPSCVIVVGDVNSTLACSLVAVKLGVPVVHVEAGLRSYDRSMPEEINRVLTDQISDVLYTSERGAHANLLREGIAEERIHFVGNIMIDSLLEAMKFAVAPRETLRREGWGALAIDGATGYALVTLHRPSNVDDVESLRQVVSILDAVSERLPVVWPLHPRTAANLQRCGLDQQWINSRVARLAPVGYLEMAGLMKQAKVVVTDSGGVQEETTALGVPCLTMRPNTERPVTVEQGTNTLVPRTRDAVLDCIEDILANGGKRGRIPELWDGQTAVRIARHLTIWITQRNP